VAFASDRACNDMAVDVTFASLLAMTGSGRTPRTDRCRGAA
jgi:hypothetical protein